MHWQKLIRKRGKLNSKHLVIHKDLIALEHSVVTISFNGDVTIASTDNKTVSVIKYYKDEYSQEAGAIEAIKKLYSRSFPQKGDPYYAVNTRYEKAHVEHYCYTDGTVARGFRESGNFYAIRDQAQQVANKVNELFEKNKEELWHEQIPIT